MTVFRIGLSLLVVGVAMLAVTGGLAIYNFELDLPNAKGLGWFVFAGIIAIVAGSQLILIQDRSNEPRGFEVGQTNSSEESR